MSVGEFTASSIAVDADAKEEDANKKRSKIDYSKLEAVVASNTELASKVRLQITPVTCKVYFDWYERTSL